MGLCALEGSFRRGFAQCRRRPVYKPPSERGCQCAKPMATKSRVRKPLAERGPQCTHPGRAHWRGRSDGTLRSAGDYQCTNPLPDKAASAQSQRRRIAERTHPRRNEVRSVHSRAVRTGGAVPGGPAQCLEGVAGPCALEGSFRRGFAQCRRRPVYKPPSGQRHQCAQPATTNGRVYTPQQKRGPQCTQPGHAHWDGRSDGTFAQCRK